MQQRQWRLASAKAAAVVWLCARSPVWVGRRPPYYGRHSLGRVWFALDRGSGPHCRVLQGALHCAAPARAGEAVQCVARTGLEELVDWMLLPEKAGKCLLMSAAVCSRCCLPAHAVLSQEDCRQAHISMRPKGLELVRRRWGHAAVQATSACHVPPANAMRQALTY